MARPSCLPRCSLPRTSRTKILDVRGFDSNISVLRVGILMSIGNSQEMLRGWSPYTGETGSPRHNHLTGGPGKTVQALGRETKHVHSELHIPLSRPCLPRALHVLHPPPGTLPPSRGNEDGSLRTGPCTCFVVPCCCLSCYCRWCDMATHFSPVTAPHISEHVCCVVISESAWFWTP